MSDSIKEIISNVAFLGEPLEQITDDTSLDEDLGINSFEMHRLSYELEKKYNIDISAETLKQFVKVRDVINYMTLNVSNGSPEIADYE